MTISTVAVGRLAVILVLSGLVRSIMVSPRWPGFELTVYNPAAGIWLPHRIGCPQPAIMTHMSPLTRMPSFAPRDRRQRGEYATRFDGV